MDQPLAHGTIVAFLVFYPDTKFFSISAIWLFPYLIIHVFIGVALLSFFQNFPMHSFLGCLAQEAQYSVYLGFRPAFFTKINHFWLWFKVRDVCLFLSLEHMEYSIGLLVGLISVVSSQYWTGEQGAPRRNKLDRRANLGVGQPEHRQHLLIKFAISQWVLVMELQTIAVVTLKITDHISPW